MSKDVQVLFERAQKAARSTGKRWPAVDAEDVASDLLLKVMASKDKGAWYASQPEGQAVAALIRKAEAIASSHQSAVDRANGRWLIGDDIAIGFLESHFAGETVSGLYSGLFFEVLPNIHEKDLNALRAVYGDGGGHLPGAVRTRASRAKAKLVKLMNWANIKVSREVVELPTEWAA